MKYADIIIPHGRSNTVAIDFVVSNLKTRVPIQDLKNSTPGKSMFKDFSIEDPSPLRRDFDTEYFEVEKSSILFKKVEAMLEKI